MKPPATSHQSPLICSVASEADALACRGLAQLSPIASGTMMYMPAGLHTITPFGGTDGDAITVNVVREDVAELERQREAIAAKGKKAFVDFSHNPDADKAAFWIDGFVWQDAPEPGIYCRGEWTGSGRAAVEAKDYRYFSPVFHVDRKKGTSPQNPARIVCRTWAGANMGGLVNEPAFHKISPLWAREQAASAYSAGAAGQQPNQTKHADTMNEQELAALRATIEEQNKEIAMLKAELAAAKGEKKETAAIESALATKEAQLRANIANEKLGVIMAKNAKLEAEDKARREADAEKAVQAAVARGALPAKDQAIQAKWKALIVADPANEALLASQNGNALLGQRMTSAPVKASEHRGNAGIVGTRAALMEYAALVCKGARTDKSDLAAKAALAKEAGELFAAELKGRDSEWMHIRMQDAIQAADVTDTNVGVLSGTLVLQQSLPKFKYKYPVLNAVFTDFDSTPGLYQQTETTRIVVKPAVTSYDATLDSNGRPIGFVVVKPAQTVDVSLTLDEYVAVGMVFGQVTLGSTVRDLFGEQSDMAVNSLAGYFVDKATGLMTSANFNAYQANSVTGGATTNGSTAITYTSSTAVYPGQAISGTGIPTGTRIASVTSGTAAVLTQKATATGSSLTFTLNGGKVDTNYTTYIKAKADFNLASLDDVSAAFDQNEVPSEDRGVLVNAPYYNRLRQDPALSAYFAAVQNPEIITKGTLPELTGFAPYKAPYFPSSSNRTGFAFHKAAIALKARIPADFTKQGGTMVPGNVSVITDPDTKLSVMLVQRVDLVGNYSEWRIEALLGAAVGDRRGGLVITSA